MSAQITEEMIRGAQATQEKYGVPASVTLAQIIQESSGSYPGGLSRLAYEAKNLFGIKGTGTAGSVTMGTTEYGSGGAYSTSSAFRKYNNFMESIEDHGKLLAGSIYTPYTKNAKTADEYARAIHQAGYATDPNYADSLINIMKKYNLYQYDSGKIGGVVDTSGGSSTQSSSGGNLVSNILNLNTIYTWIIIVFLLIFGALFMASAFIDNPVGVVKKVVK